MYHPNKVKELLSQLKLIKMGSYINLG